MHHKLFFSLHPALHRMAGGKMEELKQNNSIRRSEKQTHSLSLSFYNDVLLENSLKLSNYSFEDVSTVGPLLERVATRDMEARRMLRKAFRKRTHWNGGETWMFTGFNLATITQKNEIKHKYSDKWGQWGGGGSVRLIE